MRAKLRSAAVWAAAAAIVLALVAPGCRAKPVEPNLTGPGFSLVLPAGWNAARRAPLAYTLTGPEGQAADLYVQPLRGITADEYINYTNQHITSPIGGARLLEQNGRGWASRAWEKLTHRTWPGGRVELAWTRPGVGPDDLNFYREINRVETGAVYTFVLRTVEKRFTADSAALRSMVESLKPTDLGEAVPERQPRPEHPNPDLTQIPDPNPMIQSKYAGPRTLEFRLPAEGLVWGIFDGSAPFELEPLRDLEASLGHHFDLVMTYRDFNHGSPFPLEEIRQAGADGRLTMITWQPWIYTKLTDPLLIPRIVAGEEDEHIRSWARGVKAFGQPILFRYANEMNGDWDPWSVWYFGLDHSLYIRAWHHIWEIFREEGATNAMWVWNPHDRSFPNFVWNDPHLYYPGDQYVDWIGLTGYNNGKDHPEGWRTFDQTYGPIYTEYRMLYPDKPFLITEFSSVEEEGYDKGAWVADMMKSIKGYPNIRLAVWFNKPWNNGKWLYPMDSSPGSWRAWVESLRDPYFKNGTVRPLEFAPQAESQATP